ncbi:hypothetical protein QNH20_15190 [Neobacillus sp. WH10]|uniref:hypothetical protein n=1 Tax=Neobacillus sp. WH10 TaxID=3047873 RepID=UPI0024C1D968|nr:hypothetical protein [Neobacillus sp. WH10]WHY75486.1 hypothetical protein QNH20_15190 [Neobacillus sp. WH10]
MFVYYVRKIFSYIFYGEALLHGWLKERLVQFLQFPFVGIGLRYSIPPYGIQQDVRSGITVSYGKMS